MNSRSKLSFAWLVHLLWRSWMSWQGLEVATRRLLCARFWRSLSQGALVVDLSLYLHALDWSGVAIGAALTGGGLFSAVMSLVVGVVSDRGQRKPFVIFYEVLTCLCAITAIVTTNPWLLLPAIVLAGFGRGATGSAGPFAPAEQAWLAEVLKPEQRGMIYSLNLFFGFSGMTLGALAAALPGIWYWHSSMDAVAYRPLFGLVLIGNLINLGLVIKTPEQRSKKIFNKQRNKKESSYNASSGLVVSRAQENKFLRRLMSLNALNGLAVGLIGPLIAYWFALKFSIGSQTIGPFMAVAFLMTAVTALGAGFVTRRIGMVRTVFYGRGAGVVFLALMPLMPIYWLAQLLYVLRSMSNRGTAGARQAMVISAIRDKRRGLAVSLNGISMMVPMAIGPTIAGGLIDNGWFGLPFYIAAILQGLYVIFYVRLFAPLERKLNEQVSE